MDDQIVLLAKVLFVISFVHKVGSTIPRCDAAGLLSSDDLGQCPTGTQITDEGCCVACIVCHPGSRKATDSCHTSCIPCIKDWTYRGETDPDMDCLSCLRCELRKRQYAKKCQLETQAECGSCMPGYKEQREYGESERKYYSCVACKTDDTAEECMGAVPAAVDTIGCDVPGPIDGGSRPCYQDTESKCADPEDCSCLVFILIAVGASVGVMMIIIIFVFFWCRKMGMTFGRQNSSSSDYERKVPDRVHFTEEQPERARMLTTQNALEEAPPARQRQTAQIQPMVSVLETEDKKEKQDKKKEKPVAERTDSTEAVVEGWVVV